MEEIVIEKILLNKYASTHHLLARIIMKKMFRYLSLEDKLKRMTYLSNNSRNPLQI